MDKCRHEHDDAVVKRMARAIGHMNAVKKMIEEGRDCNEILVQLSAVRSEITNVSKVVLKDHIDHCIIDSIREGDEGAITDLKGAIDKLL